jgi:exoribonuclease R
MPNLQSHLDLQAIAKEVMRQHGFEPDFPPAVQQQLSQLRAAPPAITAGPEIRDLRKLLWSSIDNDTSRDLDQIEVAERLPNGDVKVLIGIADLDAYIPKQSAIDQHAAKETTTVYAGVRNFPMLPEELSTGKTSLLEGQDCLSVVIEIVVDGGRVYLQRRLSRSGSQSRATAVQLGWRLAGGHGRGTGQGGCVGRSSGPASFARRSCAEAEAPAL